MKELLAIIAASVMEAIGVIGFACGIMDKDLAQIGYKNAALIIAGIALVVFVCICTYLKLKNLKLKQRAFGVVSYRKNAQKSTAKRMCA